MPKKLKERAPAKTAQLRKRLKREDPLAGDLSFLLTDKEDWLAVSFELKPKDKTITLRLSDELLSAIKARAKKSGVNYQKWIRASLEEALKAS